MPAFNASLHKRTPIVAVLNNRGYVVREMIYNRHPDTPNVTDERITRHQYDARGQLVSSIDPRLYEAMQQAGSELKPNFRYHNPILGGVLKTESVDAGRASLLNDALGRPVISRNAEGVITRWHYESECAGRLLSLTEQALNVEKKVSERFVYAQDTPENRTRNLTGFCIAHYDTAGVKCIKSLSLTGAPLSVTQQLLHDDADADWQGETEAQWQQKLVSEIYRTDTTVDTKGAVLSQTDAKGNVHGNQYDVAGMLKSSTLTLKGESTAAALFQTVTYSASGQKQQEIHGNGVVSTYTYEPETQRLTGRKIERPATHHKGARVFQDLKYTYDPVGNVLSVENKAEATRFFRNRKIEPENTYRYDTLDQLISATGREMASAEKDSQIILSDPICPMSDKTQYTAYTRDYHYDRGGNLTKIRHHATEKNRSYSTDILISNKSNRGVIKTEGLLPEQVNDLFHPGGHQKSLVKGQPLTWTPRGELSKVTMTPTDNETYRYGAASQRVIKITQRQHSGSVHTEKVIYLGKLEIRTRHQGGKLKEELHRIHFGNIQFLHWETGKPADIENNQQRHSHGDLINSRGLELDQNGELISQEEYYPYGGTALYTARTKTEADYKMIRYSGKERDATGLYYYGYRYYQSWLGRWLSSDPAGTIDGLNLYRMARNNPVRYYDLDGLTPEDEQKKSQIPLDEFIEINHTRWKGEQIVNTELWDIFAIETYEKLRSAGYSEQQITERNDRLNNAKVEAEKKFAAKLKEEVSTYIYIIESEFFNKYTRSLLSNGFLAKVSAGIASEKESGDIRARFANQIKEITGVSFHEYDKAILTALQTKTRDVLYKDLKHYISNNKIGKVTLSYRGTVLSDAAIAQLEDVIKSNKAIQFDQFISTSSNILKTAYFAAKGEEAYPGFNKVAFLVEGSSGAKIGLHIDEKEIVYSSETKYKVSHVSMVSKLSLQARMFSISNYRFFKLKEYNGTGESLLFTDYKKTARH